jgi:hypothetical protein
MLVIKYIGEVFCKNTTEFPPVLLRPSISDLERECESIDRSITSFYTQRYRSIGTQGILLVGPFRISIEFFG